MSFDDNDKILLGGIHDRLKEIGNVLSAIVVILLLKLLALVFILHWMYGGK